MKKKSIYIVSIILTIILLCAFLVACKDGTDGVDGKSAYDLAVEQGFEGTLDEWLASLKGTDGRDGYNGSDGTDGKADINEIYEKAVEEGFEGSYVDFLKEYLNLSTDLQAVSNIALLSAVKVYVSDSYKTYFGTTPISALGSGVIYRMNKENGTAYIITNYHVVYNGSLTSEDGIYRNIKVFLYGYEGEEQGIDAKYIAGAYDYDIAILKITDSEILKNSDAQAVKVASSKDVVVGSSVFAVGNPGTGSNISYTDVKISVTQGILSVDSENVSIADSTSKYSVSTRVMRVDAAINSGNSGGGLYNSNGELIGIVNAKLASSDIDNIGYAIPSDVAVGIAEYAIANCDGENNRYVSKIYLGISGVVNSSKAVYDSSTSTVKIQEEIAVGEIADSSMVKDVLQVGDILSAVEFDGVKYYVTRSYSLPDCLWNAEAGKTTSIKFYITRDGEDLTVDVTVSADSFVQLK